MTEVLNDQRCLNISDQYLLKKDVQKAVRQRVKEAGMLEIDSSEWSLSRWENTSEIENESLQKRNKISAFIWCRNMVLREEGRRKVFWRGRK